MEVGTLQPFLDAYVKEHGGASTTSTARMWPGIWPPAPAISPSCCPPWARSSSFPPSSGTGCSPQDLLHGEAHDKRFYLEARKIR
ncbi:hypothetical protein M5E87_14395 [Flavonifractor plautii]|nr:hypothetical protein M5E87_14395 [Flavonifractor plautii]